MSTKNNRWPPVTPQIRARVATWLSVRQAANASAGRLEKARLQAVEIIRIDPQFSLEHHPKMYASTKKLVDQVIEYLLRPGPK